MCTKPPRQDNGPNQSPTDMGHLTEVPNGLNSGQIKELWCIYTQYTNFLPQSHTPDGWVFVI